MPVAGKLAIPKAQVAEFCKKNHIRELSIFGSALRDDFTPASDVDVLVESDPLRIPGLIRLAGMEIELSEIIGRKVDLRTAQDLSRHSTQEVVESAELQYAEG